MRHKADDRTDGHPDARSHRDADACSHGDADTRSHGDAVHRRDANARPGAAPLSASGTGINPWWRYQEEDVPGAGHVMVNVGTGNLLIQVDDMSVPHKGMALAFRRTYNSQSLHNVNGADGSPPGLYGNGWTNTFDAHLVQTSIGLSVYDIDGARYDYNCTSGTCVPPPGQHATLTSDGGCGLLWTKKTGTIYYFWNFNLSACGVPTWEITAYGGRLYEIIGRNRNTSLTFYYSWTTAGPGAQPAAIMATTESGLSTTLSFSLVSGYELLTQLTRPDGTTVTYSYDTYGNLTAVGKPAPNSSGGTVYETYGAVPYAGSYVTAWAASPRWAVDNGACSDPHVDCGGYLSFAYVPGATLGTTTLSQIQHVGYVDPTIADGSNSGPIQPLPGNGSGVAAAPFLGEYYTLSALGTARTPTFQDTEGHYTNWVVDASGRPTQTQECTGTQGSPTTGMTCTGLFLTSNEGWDANNNRTAEVDPRGYETDHAYDPNGNSIATASPQLTTAQGTFRPTALYSYDSFNNVVAYCDPVATAQLGGNWTTSAPSPSDALCPQTTLATQFQYTYPTYEPYGELQVTTSPATAAAPNGYHHTFSYATAQQSGADFGLPTSVVGDSFTQADGTTRQPTQVFWYDYNGNVGCYSKGSGYWTLFYDAANRLLVAADPDDAAAGSGICGKTGAQPGWSTSTILTYYPDGSRASIQTASQVAAGVIDQRTYDTDGDEISETHHYACTSTSTCTAGTTTKWYDGADRLVEVQQPYDGWDIQGYPWSTRYIYDLSQGQTTAYQGMALTGYGNLVSTRELLSGTLFRPTQVYPISSATWTDVRATSYDALDRPLNTYEAALGNQPKDARIYDVGGNLGLLSSDALATGEVKVYSYDPRDQISGTQYSGDSGVTPALQFLYDADGRIANQTTSVLGTETLSYDNAGELVGEQEPSSLGGGTASYTFYGDGTRKALNYSDAIQSYSSVASYSYRPDGMMQTLQLSNAQAFQWTYTAAGREETEADPFSGVTISPTAAALVTVGKLTKLYPRYPTSMTYGPRSVTYDTFGRIVSLTLPAGMIYSYPTGAYDLEDVPIAENRTFYIGGALGLTASPPITETVCITSNIRNEKVPNNYSPSNVTSVASCALGVQPEYSVDLNGTILPLGVQGSVESEWLLDARNGMLFNSQGTDSYGNVSGITYSYDASGRLLGDSELIEPITQSACPIPLPGICPSYSSGVRTKAYDAENRLRSESYSIGEPLTLTNPPGALPSDTAEQGLWFNVTNQYNPLSITALDYGAAGHPVRFALLAQTAGSGAIPGTSQPSTEAWLWDGNDRLLTCTLNASAQCTAPRFSLNGVAEFSPSTGVVTVNDRNRYGSVADRHTSTAFGPWFDTDGLQRATMVGITKQPISMCSDEQAPTDMVCFPVIDGKKSPDGWNRDMEQWQGVRSFDTNVGQWNTPDAYVGKVHDPMSQKPYMWNRNNPYSYADPSGYDAYVGFTPNLIAQHAMVILTGKSGAAERYSWGPAKGTRNTSDRTSNVSASSSSSSPGSSLSPSRTGGMTVDSGTLRSLSDSAYAWKDLHLSDAETQAFRGALNNYASTHSFNVLTSNCDEAIRSALHEIGRDDLANQMTGVPALDAHDNLDLATKPVKK